MGLIRILLALSILIHHSHSLFGIDILGLDPALRTFYIISGFYMALILNEKYIGKNGSYRLFISNRFLRIFPTYWFVLIITYIANFILFNQNIFHQSPFYILRDFTLLVRTDYLQFSTSLRDPFTIGVVYTLVLELYFYLVAPFIARRKIKILLLLTSLAFFIHFLVLGILRLQKLPAEDWFFPEVIIYFLLGVLAYKLYARIRNKKINKYLMFVSYISLVLMTIFYTKLPEIIILRRFIDIKEWLYLLIMTFSIPFIFKATNKIKLDRLFGELSYPIYLCHVLVYSILLNLKFISIDNNTLVVILIITTFIFSFLIRKVVELPIEVIRQKRLKVSNNK